MKKEYLSAAVRMAIALILTLSASWLTAMLLNVDESAVPVYVAAGALTVLFFFRHLAQGFWRTALSALLTLLFLAAAFFLILYIVVIPYNFYVSWLNMVQAGRPGGVISYLFFISVVFFGCLFTGLAGRAGLAAPTAALAMVVSFELAVIHGSIPYALLFSVLALAVILSLTIGRSHMRPGRLLLPLPAFAAAVLFSLLFSAGSTPGSGDLVTRSLDPQIKRFLVGIFPDLPGFTAVAGFGYAYKDEVLGAKPQLAQTPLFRVESAEQRILYLRTEVFDSYGDGQWRIGPYCAERMRKDPTDILGMMTLNGRPVRITVLFDYLTLMPHPLSTRSILIPGQDIARVKSGNIDSGFRLALPLLKNDRLVIATGPASDATDTRDRQTADGAGHRGDAASERENLLLKKRIEQTLAIEIETAVKRSGPADDAYLSHFLEVPDNVTPKVRELAASFAQNESRPWRILVAAYQYLRDNCRYSLDTRETPIGEDFLEDFLFHTRKGYSVHFATAFVVLARLNGIPARYATGFFVYLPPGKINTEVTGLNSHAWPEVWFSGLGWTRLEATPAFDLVSKYGPEYYRIFNQDNDDLTARQLEALMGDHITPPETVPRNIIADLSPFFLPAGGCAAALLLLLLLGKRLRRFFKARPPYRGDLGKLSRELKKLSVAMEKRLISSPERIGWRAWGQKAAARFPSETDAITNIVTTVQHILFAGVSVTKPAIRNVSSTRRRLTVNKRD